MVQRVIFFFLGGAAFGTVGDYFHVLFGIDGYFQGIPELPWSGQPVWVPFLFGAATVGMGMIHPEIYKRLGPKKPLVKSSKSMVIGCCVFLFLYAASGFVPLDTGGGKDLMLFCGALMIWYIYDRSWQGIFLAGGTAFLGVLVELILTHQSIFYYHPHASNLSGIPSWLPWLYASASITVGNLGRILHAEKRLSWTKVLA